MQLHGAASHIHFADSLFALFTRRESNSSEDNSRPLPIRKYMTHRAKTILKRRRYAFAIAPSPLAPFKAIDAEAARRYFSICRICPPRTITPAPLMSILVLA